MSNEKIIKKLIKIAEAQQKVIIKIAQLSNDDEYIRNFIRSSVLLWMTNNGVPARDKFTISTSDDPNVAYDIVIELSPATKMPLSEDAAAKLKEFLVAKMAQDSNLKSKSINLDVQVPETTM